MRSQRTSPEALNSSRSGRRRSGELTCRRTARGGGRPPPDRRCPKQRRRVRAALRRLTIARNFLAEIGPPPVRPDRAVLRISAYEVQDDLLAVLQQLGRSGYTIALDADDGSGELGSLMALRSSGPRDRLAARAGVTGAGRAARVTASSRRSRPRSSGCRRRRAPARR